ncbi:MAG: YDG domain-containing protein, partial [Janthinobacterium lividum]
SLGNVAFNGVVAGDALTSGTGSVGTFDTKNVGAGKRVTGGGIVLAGADAGNYALDATSAIGSASVTPKTITATADVAAKVYDGNTRASLGNVAFNGVVAGDALTSGTGSVGTFDTKNVGAGKRVTGGGIVLAGADAGNYRVDGVGVVGQGTIAPKTLTVGEAQISPKVYDGTTVANVGTVALGGIVGDDRVVGAGGRGNFDTATVGTDKLVTVSALTLTGADAGNYAVDRGETGGRGTIVAQQTVGAPVSLIADPSGANATSNASSASSAQGTAGGAGAVAQAGSIAAASIQAGLVTTVPAPSGQQVMLAAGTPVQPLVLTDAVLTGNGRLSLAIDDGTASAPVRNTLAVFSTRSAAQATPQSEGQYEVSDRGNAITLVSTNALARTTPPQVTPVNAQTSSGSVALNDGGVMELRIALQTDGSLVVQVPPNGTGMDAEAITAYALTIAKKRFGIAAENVKAVLVQYAQRSAATGKATTVAGL